MSALEGRVTERILVIKGFLTINVDIQSVAKKKRQKWQSFITKIEIVHKLRS